jgi:hypothetical protein
VLGLRDGGSHGGLVVHPRSIGQSAARSPGVSYGPRIFATTALRMPSIIASSLVQ